MTSGTYPGRQETAYWHRMHTGQPQLSATGSAWIARARYEVRAFVRQSSHLVPLIALCAFVIVLLTQLSDPPPRWLAGDSRAYWEAIRASDPYQNAQLGGSGAYLYSPAFRLVMAPAGFLPWPAFLFGWAALGISLAIAMGTGVARRHRWLWLPIGILALLDIWAGNINLLLAAAIVVGFRWPAAWSFVILTKVTPGIGLLWFAVRREWHSEAIALGVTVLIIGLSAMVSPHAWLEWVSVLLTNSNPGELSGDIAIPAFVRFPVAVVLTVWGAYRNQRWVLPVACLLLLPVIWPAGLAILVGSAALIGRPGIPAGRTSLPQPSSRPVAERGAA